MRPRKTPAENLDPCPPRRRGGHGFNEAAENTRGKLLSPENLNVHSARFNEAAENTRGKPGRPPGTDQADAASMRPRKTPAENPFELPSPAGRRGGFNEAAENTRGKRRPAARSAGHARGFNEAAENTRGKRPVAGRAGRARRASMRPRKTPAENAVRVPRGPWGGPNASMRPRKTPAENNQRAADHRASMRPRKTPAENNVAGAPSPDTTSRLQ